MKVTLSIQNGVIKKIKTKGKITSEEDIHMLLALEALKESSEDYHMELIKDTFRPLQGKPIK